MGAPTPEELAILSAQERDALRKKADEVKEPAPVGEKDDCDSASEEVSSEGKLIIPTWSGLRQHGRGIEKFRVQFCAVFQEEATLQPIVATEKSSCHLATSLKEPVTIVSTTCPTIAANRNMASPR